MKSIFLSAIFLSLTVAACNDGSGSSASKSNLSFERASSAPASAETSGDGSEASNLSQSSAAKMATNTSVAGRGPQGQILKQNISLAQTSASTIDTASSDRKVIRNAELNLEAENPEEAQREITTIAEIKGGFVVESQQSSSDGAAGTRDTVVMAVRVPSERFGETLNEIRETSTRVVLETVKGQDVTEEFIDVEAQIRAKKALEQQFMEIMKRANNVADALDVQRQLADVRGEIERIEGRKRFLQNQSSLSTIKIRLQTAKVFAASSVGITGRISESFAAGAEVALTFVLGVVTFIVAALPFGLILGLPLFLFVRYVLRRQQIPRSVVETADDEFHSR